MERKSKVSRSKEQGHVLTWFPQTVLGGAIASFVKVQQVYMLTLTFIKWAQEIPKQIMVHYYAE